jgi:hypothetical protein
MYAAAEKTNKQHEQSVASVQRRKNSSGLPDRLKSGTENSSGQYQNVIQLIGLNENWNDEQRAFQGSKTSKKRKRISGDANWLAMERFTKHIPQSFKDAHSVQEVLDEAALYKQVSFEDWKGLGKDGTSREAQHLISAGAGIQWGLTDKMINSSRNGKMLLAGRLRKNKAQGQEMTDKAGIAKKKRRLNKSNSIDDADINKGARHIGKKGVAHPKYDKAMKNYVESNFPFPLSQGDFETATDHLRGWHKQFDFNSMKSIDELAETTPPGKFQI